MKSNRRDFLAMVAAPLAAFWAGLSFKLFAAEAGKLVDPKDKMAVGLKYTPKAPADMKKAGKTCATCLQYTPQGDTGKGICTIFAGALVEGSGYCTAWFKKA